MFTPLQSTSLRRIPLEELSAKLQQIEEHASLALSEHPRGQLLPRLRLILGIAKQLRLHVEDQMQCGARLPAMPAQELGRDAVRPAGLQP